ncbi:hybrid signal transduction histidine kinase L isoform X1 [Condylostylus longicornis]|uniref:hybrid signal transduction histidine kinase L isoform X1 n=1 Tax=Condylostylus longicornis TaxID=2530218 RepID=UPI00244E2E00|nr:hybrid signal transduction histidine kinase L isoform X1 [Condylostylus longicornis]
MSASLDENNRDTLQNNSIVSNINLNANNIDNNVTIDHPLSNIQIGKLDNTIDKIDDDMTEINLKLEDDQNGNKLNANITLEVNDNANSTSLTVHYPNKLTDKSKWVKFDEENNENNVNENSNTTLYNINNSNNIINNNSPATQIQKLEAKTQTSPLNISTPKSQSQKALKQLTQVGSVTSTAPSSSGVAVLTTESTHVNIDRINTSNINSHNNNDGNRNNTVNSNNTPKNVSISMPTSSPIRTVELSTGRIREGFANGDVIVNLLPTNTKWPWITPAVFRPELVPEELMAQGLTLTVEEYVSAMESLVNDYRFTLYNICYKRVLVCWITFAFCVLLVLLFSGLQGIALFALGVAWLFLNAAAIFACMWMKLRLSRGLEKCLGRVNKQLLRHKILLVLDDRGRISCHKVNLCFMYFDPAQCIAYLNEFIERQEQLGNSIQAGWEKKLDLDLNDIVIQGSNPVRLSRKQAVAQKIFLTYLQRWGKDFLRRRLDWTCNEAGVHEQPRHLMSSVCPCQYEEEILHNKIKLEQEKAQCCCGLHNPFKHL